MKDAAHHLKQLQKKIIQENRKTQNKPLNGKTILSGYSDSDIEVALRKKM